MQTHIEVFQYVHAQHIGYKFASPIWVLQVALHYEGITGESSWIWFYPEMFYKIKPKWIVRFWFVSSLNSLFKICGLI